MPSYSLLASRCRAVARSGIAIRDMEKRTFSSSPRRVISSLVVATSVTRVPVAASTLLLTMLCVLVCTVPRCSEPDGVALRDGFMARIVPFFASRP